MKSKISKILILLLFISSILITGCEKDITTGNDDGTQNDEIIENDIKEYEPAYGGKITVPVYNVKTLNPMLNGDVTVYHFNKLIFEGLFDYDNNLDIKNVLAESYEVKNDGKTIDIKLREDVYWHKSNDEESVKFNADDVKFTIEVLKYGAKNTLFNDLLSSVYKTDTNNLIHILRVKVKDDYNISIEFDRAYGNALESLVFPIIAKHQFSVYSGFNDQSYKNALQSELSFIPKGTGPYKISEFNKLKSIELVSNDNWWNGKPYIENITGMILPDKELLTTSFEAGKLDLTLSKEVDWEKYSNNEKINKFEFITQNYEFLGFNFNNELFNGNLGQEVRKAMAYAIDVESIVEKVYLGRATIIDVPLQPNSWLVNEDANVFGYDVDKAKGILRENGFDDRDSDGILEDLSGRKLSFRLLTNTDNELRFKTANMIINNLKDIGIEVLLQLKTNSNNEYNQWQDVQQKIFVGDYDITLLGWELSHIPDLSFAFHSSQIGEGYNFINYKNDVMDNLLIRAFSARNSEEKKNAFDEIQTVISNDLPYISLFFKNGAILMNKKVHGDIQPQSFNIYYNIDRWFIPEELREEQNDKSKSL